jgi:two-component system chemotaxis response regulator CheB
MGTERIVVIGASAGGVRPLEDLVAGLPLDFPAAVLIVLHLSARHPSLLPQVLAAAGPLPVAHAESGQKLTPGRIHVAIPDHHLLVNGDELLVTGSPKENHHRPSIDLLFRSAAYHYRSRAVGVVLSGALSDGSSGLFSIHRLGGVTVIQDPNEAPCSSMPLSALRRVDIDHTLRAKEIGAILADIVRQPPGAEPTGAESYRAALKDEVDIAAGKPPLETAIMNTLEPSPYTCPDCTGVLFRIKEGRQDRFRCHTGHGFSAAALWEECLESFEETHWLSIKAMQESLMLLTDGAGRAAAAGEQAAADALQTTVRELEERLEKLRALGSKPRGAALSNADAAPAAMAGDKR